MLLLVLFAISVGSLSAQNIEVVFKGIRSSEGQIVLKVYVDQKSFDDDKPIKTFKYKKAGIVNEEMKATLDLDPGTYGFALLDDENSDGEMEYGFLGIPDEGFGFSNYYLSGLSKPKFEVFKFTVIKDQKQKVLMKIRYM